MIKPEDDGHDGYQENPGSGFNLQGDTVTMENILDLCKVLGGVSRLD